MIRSNQKQIETKKIKNKAGYDAHESRFGGWDRELRKHKKIAIPSLNINAAVWLEQGWNKAAKAKDVVRIMVEEDDQELSVVVTREELEQALAYMAQGDEMIKYVAPKIKYGSNINAPGEDMGYRI